MTDSRLMAENGIASPTPREFCRRILSLSAIQAALNKRYLHSVSLDVIGLELAIDPPPPQGEFCTL